MIDRHHELPVTHQAKLLKVSRGSVYYLPKPVSQADLALMRRIDELYLKHPFTGARMLRDQLNLDPAVTRPSRVGPYDATAAAGE